MELRPYRVWQATALLNAVAWLLLDRYRLLPLTPLLFTHLGIFIWGIFDLRLQFFIRARRRGRPGDRRLAITFDDGPDPALTGAVLDVLRTHEVKATFFVVGERAQRYPELVWRMYEEGHVVACHDFYHSSALNFRMTARMTREIDQARRLLHGIIGRTPRLYRPPNGLTNPHLPRALAGLSMECVGWSRSVRDAGNVRRQVLGRISELAAPTQIIMLHDVLLAPENRELVIERIGALCLSLREKNLQAVGVDELLGIAAYSD